MKAVNLLVRNEYFIKCIKENVSLIVISTLPIFHNDDNKKKQLSLPQTLFLRIFIGFFNKHAVLRSWHGVAYVT